MSADISVMRIDEHTSLQCAEWAQFTPPLVAGFYIVATRDSLIEGDPVGPYDTRGDAETAMLAGAWINPTWARKRGSAPPTRSAPSTTSRPKR